MKKPEPKVTHCRRCNYAHAPYGFKYPFLDDFTVVSLCVTCYKLLKAKEPDKTNWKKLLQKYK